VSLVTSDHFFFRRSNFHQGRSNLSATEISIEFFDVSNSLLHELVIVGHTCRVHSLKIAAKTNNIEERVFGQRFQKQN